MRQRLQKTPVTPEERRYGICRQDRLLGYQRQVDANIKGRCRLGDLNCSRNAEPDAMSDVEVRIPRRCALQMPALTRSDSPKSSAWTISLHAGIWGGTVATSIDLRVRDERPVLVAKEVEDHDQGGTGKPDRQVWQPQHVTRTRIRAVLTARPARLSTMNRRACCPVRPPASNVQYLFSTKLLIIPAR